MMLLISKQYLRKEIVITGGLQLTKRSLKNSGIVAHLWESFLSKNFKKRVVCLHSPYWESTVYFQIKSQFPELVFFFTKGKQQYSNSSIDYGPGDSFWSKYHPGRRPSGLSSDGISVFVDPHILSTPLITDFNGDGTEEELVIVTNFYFEEERYEVKLFVTRPLLLF